jgi:hypothetical protein
MKFNPEAVYFIKLGRGGEWEKDCILESDTLRFSFKEVPDELCQNGTEDEITNWVLEKAR